MTIDWKAVVPVLESVAEVAEFAAGAVGRASPEWGAVAEVVAAALKFAADAAQAGLSPIDKIERIHAADPDLAAVEDSWQEELRKRFGGP